MTWNDESIIYMCVTAAALPGPLVPSGAVMLNGLDLSHFQKQNTWWVWNWITWISKKTKTESGSVRSVGVLECEHLRCLSIISAAQDLFQDVCQSTENNQLFVWNTSSAILYF